MHAARTPNDPYDPFYFALRVVLQNGAFQEEGGPNAEIQMSLEEEGADLFRQLRESKLHLKENELVIEAFALCARERPPLGKCLLVQAEENESKYSTLRFYSELKVALQDSLRSSSLQVISKLV